MPSDPVATPDQPLSSDPIPKFQIERWGPILLLLALLIMIIISWGRWMDIIVDFSLQVYAPWQLSQGQVLYKDIIYIYGPLSAYIHSLVFLVFGPGVSVLAWFNIGLIVILSAIIQQLFRNLFDSLTGFMAALSFIVVFAFGNYLQTSNYNFVCAYEYTLPHGIFLSFVALHQFVGYLRNPQTRTLFSIGLLSGLILLTKPEVFLAEIAALGIGLWLAFQVQNISLKDKLKNSLIFFTAFSLPSLGFMFYFSFHLPIEEAVVTPFSHLTYIFNAEIKSLPFFKAVTGTGMLADNLKYLFIVTGIYLLVYTALIFFNKAIASHLGNTHRTFWISFSVFLLILMTFYKNIFWMDLMRPLPLILTAYTGMIIYRWLFHSHTAQEKKRQIAVLALSIFSLILLLKIILKVQIQHYGFALTLPGFLVFVALLIHELPLLFKKLQGSAWVPSAFGLAFLVAHTGMMGWLSFHMYQMKDFPVGQGRDRVYDFAPHRMGTPAKPFVRGMLFNYALEWIDQELGPEEEFVTFPAVNMLNYMSRRKSPILTGLMNPGALLLTGETPVFNSLKKTFPDYIVLVDQEFPHLGARFFGQDYFQTTFQWITQNYEVARQFGARPFSHQGFGIQILRRKSSPPSP